MKRIVLAFALVLPAARGDADDPAAVAPRREVPLNGHVFTLPAGFEIELVAGPPLVDRPITAAFDNDGRLYVADSSGSNDKVDQQLAEKPHRIVRLEDTDGDGRFDRSVVFADRMMFPEGTMWYDGSLYVTAPPSIWKLTDTDGDGVADHRSEWFPAKTLTGCANDLHGPYLGPDGWIYWCKGAFAKQTYERVGKSLRVIPSLPLNIVGKDIPVAEGGAAATLPADTWSTRASHIFRCRPDGSGLEVVMTGGMDNPVDVVFTPGGERIFTTTFLQHPAGGLRDGLLHAVYGGIYGKDHDVIHEPSHPWTGPAVMPVLSHLGAAAPCGLAAYESDAFGTDYRDNVFACLFNMHKVTRHVLEPAGATFRSRDEDFVVSNHIDFHPTDVLEDADGSLIIVDTGGWYKLCCPTSQLHKPDVLGAIYRVRRSGAARPADPRGRSIAWRDLNARELAGFLDDARPAVRWRAVHELSRLGPAAVAPLAALWADPARSSTRARLHAVWTLTRVADPKSRALVRKAIRDPDAAISQAAIHSISLWRDPAAVPDLLEVLHRGSAQHRRVAAEALGRIGDARAVPALLALDAATPSSAAGQRPDSPFDRFLDHAATYALIEIGDRDATASAIDHANPQTRRRALVALSEMKHGRLEPRSITPLLTSNDPMLRETAAWIVSRHADWGDALAGYLRDRLEHRGAAAAEGDELVAQLARFGSTQAVQELLVAVLGESSHPIAVRRLALEAMRRSNLREKQLPRTWPAAVAAVLGSGDAELIDEAIATARALPVPKDQAAVLAAPLHRIGQDADAPTQRRLDALAAIPGGLNPVTADLFELLNAQFDGDRPAAARSAAADSLAKAKLSPEQLVKLTESLADVRPVELDRLLTPFGQCSDETVGIKLVESLRHPAVVTALRTDTLKTYLARFGSSVQQHAEQLYAAINVDRAKQQERLEELTRTLAGDGLEAGDIRRGQAVFMGTKAACASCHAIGYLGGKIGPDLTRIGGIRTERDLLESIAFPSASFVRSYESVVVATRDGRVWSGILKKDAPDEIVLTINATEEARIARDDIEEMKPGTVSVMPSGLEQQLSMQELADLLAFLKACR